MSAASTAYKEAAEAPATALRRHRKVGRVNHIIECATPGMLCLVRAAEPKPYTALSPETLYDVVQPHDHSLRPSPHIAHQALMDFYKICDGFYGVDREEAEVQQLTAFDHKKQQGAGSISNSSSGGGVSSLLLLGSPVLTASSSLPMLSSAGPTAAAALVLSHASAAPPPPPPALPSPDDPNLAEKLNDYRIAQLRRNAQHVDNTVYHAHGGGGGGGGGTAGVCHFYRTAEGCNRGAACPFTHLDKSGQPVQRHTR
ncbi:hypothetical protein NESM_000382400 [Novymonas esmeraldas]|uniref:C3H1-type domain-containing protein n=1 Tax=Novymonas esmeraldas TaxID=1808958 RepID=A0AAW0EMX9_9TRYP